MYVLCVMLQTLLDDFLLFAPGIQYALVPDATYVVGRVAADINCPSDQSVSEI